ncbi:hypothetical protein HRbin15_02699 [bacterium HR15]|nr:hypothetical protein HRbin15_02699 [bacterium HR15]
MRRHVLVNWLQWVLGLLVVGYSSPEHFFAEREEWSMSKTFKWKVSTELVWSSSVMQEVRQLPAEVQTQLSQQGRLSSSIRKTGAYMIIHRSDSVDLFEYQIINSTYQKAQNFYFLCGKNFVVLIQNFEIRYSEGEPTIQKQAIILPTIDKAIYSGFPTYFSGIGSEINSYHPAFHALANPLKVQAPIGWMGYDQIRWKIENNKLLLYLEKDKVGTMQLSAKHDYAPLELVIHLAKHMYTWKTKRWRQIDGHWVPSLVEYQYFGSNFIQKTNFELVSVEPSAPVDVAQFLPHGVPISDFRLKATVTDSPPRSAEDIVNYRYTGRFLTVEELKRLAYQQGNLVPPETPRRRYSLWLFAPAILFFLAAAYLYFKNRRQ